MAITQPAPEFDVRLERCPLCDAASLEDYDRDHEGRRICRCGGCGLRFLNPQYSDGYLARLYSTYFAESCFTQAPEGSDAEGLAQVHEFHLSLVEEVGVRGRLLSVGCGGGLELAIARRRGWEVEGHDVDESTVRRVAARHGVKVQAGDFLTIPWEPQSFDCVYLHHVLEHPKDPKAYLKRIHSLLRPGGILFLACPNIDSASNRVKTLAGRLGLKKKRGKHYDAWHHLFYYSPTTLKPLLHDRFGFEVLQCLNGVKGDHRTRFATFGMREAFARRAPVTSSIFLMLARKPGGPEFRTKG